MANTNIITKIRNLFYKYSIHELNAVFTPTSSAEISYIARPDIEKKLSKALDIPGKQIVIYGHSGSGKTTVLNHIIKEKKIQKIVSSCTTNSTIDSIILDAFDELNQYFTDSKSSSEKETISAGLTTEYLGIKSSINSSVESSTGEIQKRMLPPQLTIQRLSHFISSANAIWIIEDFHKVAPSEKTKISQMMKLFMDKSSQYKYSKIIVLGAAENGSEVCEYDAELNNRVSEIEVPLLMPEQIQEIATKGCTALNISISENVIKQIANYSNCLATIAHQLLYNLCYNREIFKTQKKTIFIPDSELQKAINDFSSEKQDTYKKLYLKITEHRERTYNNIEIILSALSKLPNDNVTQNIILEEIRKIHLTYPQGNLSTYLSKLCSPSFDEVLRNNSGRISFSDPFFKAYISLLEAKS